MFLHCYCYLFIILSIDSLIAKIDVSKRKEITKHHSLAHLLQAALQNVLGNEVHQAGSYVEENKTDNYSIKFSQWIKQ